MVSNRGLRRAGEIFDLLPFKELEPEIEHGFQTRNLRVAGNGTELTRLKELIEDMLETSTSTTKDLERENTEHIIRGSLAGIDYSVSLLLVGCPIDVPFGVTRAQTYHASITSPEGEEDSITPTIEGEFRIYEQGLRVPVGLV